MFLETERRVADLVRERPKDPLVLYAAYSALIGFGTASQVGQEDVSGRLIRAAKSSIDQLLKLEANDDAVQTLAANIKDGLSQDLRDRDHFAEAVAMQREVVEGRRESARETPAGNAPAGLGFSLAILGVIGKNAGDRALVCSGRKESEAVFGALDRKKRLVGFYASFLPKLRANLKRCDAGDPASHFKPLR